MRSVKLKKGVRWKPCVFAAPRKHGCVLRKNAGARRLKSVSVRKRLCFA
jgi:hypothetical protein